ncbi:hypothetical protein [Phytohabitans suffuscus]|nr:hypothetical protein [Phytohabitans suffuscus]
MTQPAGAGSPAGSLTIPKALATGITMQIATRIVDRVPPWRII